MNLIITDDSKEKDSYTTECDKSHIFKIQHPDNTVGINNNNILSLKPL